jgi:hypothetical protein
MKKRTANNTYKPHHEIEGRPMTWHACAGGRIYVWKAKTSTNPQPDLGVLARAEVTMSERQKHQQISNWIIELPTTFSPMELTSFNLISMFSAIQFFPFTIYFFLLKDLLRNEDCNKKKLQQKEIATKFRYINKWVNNEEM